MKQINLGESLFEGAISFEKQEDWIKPWRIPFSQLKLFPPEDQMVARAETAAGVRLRFRTDSTTIKLAFVPTVDPLLFDFTIHGVLIQTVSVEGGTGVAIFDNLPGGSEEVELWLPQAHVVALRHLLVDEKAEVSEIPDLRLKWITYGSSITHCGEAHSPARTWPACVARAHNLNLTCLGYGGSCHMEPMVARMIRDMPADFISLKLGINVQGGATLSPRTFQPAIIGMVQIIREKHQNTPIAVISPIISPPREEQPNAVGLSLSIMRLHVEEAVNRMIDCGDKNLYYFNGLDIFGEELVDQYLPDLLHPNGDGYEVMASNFSQVVFQNIPL